MEVIGVISRRWATTPTGDISDHRRRAFTPVGGRRRRTADGLPVINDKFMTQSTSTEALHLDRVGNALRWLLLISIQRRPCRDSVVRIMSRRSSADAICPRKVLAGHIRH